MNRKRPAKVRPIVLPLRPHFVNNPILYGGDGKSFRQSIVDPVELQRAMDALAQQLGAKPGDWADLAIKLAFAGNFVALPPRRRSKRWTPGLYSVLWLEVERWRHLHPKLTSRAQVFNDDDFLQRWLENSGEGDTPDSLEQRYLEAEKSLGSLVPNLQQARDLDPVEFADRLDPRVDMLWEWVSQEAQRQQEADDVRAEALRQGSTPKL